MRLIILRGLPGSGKSHYASRLVDAHVISHHDTLPPIVPDGIEWRSVVRDTNKRVREALRSQTPLVVVDNCHATKKSYQALIDMAAEHGYTHEVVSMHEDAPTPADIEQGVRRNVHGTSREVIAGIAQRWEQ